MVRNNNVIPNGHFHKRWQSRVKTWFNQFQKKIRRQLERRRKAKTTAPRPAKRLRPKVHCSTVRYNAKKRPGRGFTLRELKTAGLNTQFAQTVGIAVDHRRSDKSVEVLQENVQRLKEYVNKLVLFPKRKAEKTPTAVIKVGKDINKVRKAEGKFRAKVPSDEEKKFDAHGTLRKARSEQKMLGRRLKRKKLQEENQGIPCAPKKVEIPDK